MLKPSPSTSECDLIWCLSPFQLLSQNATDWPVYKQQKFISHCSGSWKSVIRHRHSHVLVWASSWVTASTFLPLPHAGGVSVRSRQRVGFLTALLLIPYLWGLGFQHMSLGRGANIQAIACEDRVPTEATKLETGSLSGEFGDRNTEAGFHSRMKMAISKLRGGLRQLIPYSCGVTTRLTPLSWA